jgi:hypothetical protein
VTVPRVENLRHENWQNLSQKRRLAALQDLENGLAVQQNREACKVSIIPDDVYKSPEERQNLRGIHEDKQIMLNEQLLKNNQPYQATETLFHESRHDYQEHVAQHPELAESQQQLQDFQKNTNEGYLAPEQYGDELYLWQPVEKDARASARTQTEELFASEFGDNQAYPEHQNRIEAEEAFYKQIGEDYLGDNYEDIARQTAFARQEAFQSLQQQENLGRIESGSDAGTTLDQNGSEIANEQTNEMVEEAAKESAGAVVEESVVPVAGPVVEEGVERVATEVGDKTVALSEDFSGESGRAPEEVAKSVAEDAPSTTPDHDESEDIFYSYGH